MERVSVSHISSRQFGHKEEKTSRISCVSSIIPWSESPVNAAVLLLTDGSCPDSMGISTFRWQISQIYESLTGYFPPVEINVMMLKFQIP